MRDYPIGVYPRGDYPTGGYQSISDVSAVSTRRSLDTVSAYDMAPRLSSRRCGSSGQIRFGVSL